jgi:ferritin-like metal-binding protein YciE
VPAIEGITKEHDEFIKDENASPAIRDMFLTGSGARAEHYEIAAYTGLITMARRSARRLRFRCCRRT